jgi:hypothetical protein
MTERPRRRNPYVGPRAFTRDEGDRFFGRGHETLELFQSLAVERIVLLHSPSGAGKTSLIQAALVPELVADGFEVLPVVRVGHPALGGDVDYALSTLLYLESGRPEHEQLPIEELRRLDIDGYLDLRWPDPEPAHTTESDPDRTLARRRRIVMIFDQFEEILTLDQVDEAARRVFFNRLGAALRNRGRWALFAMREEFVAGLDPYRQAIPTQLNAHFRLPLMDRRSASEAITRPAAALGVIFEPAAAQRLVDNLRTVTVTSPAGGLAAELGATVEPLHLQVACLQLWEAWSSLGLDAIGVEHVEGLADVDRALEAYYAERVRVAAAAARVSERTLRTWIEEHLFDEHGVRLQVRRGAESIRQINDAVLTSLQDAYLVRAESARGSSWYELAHDRLVQPIRADNRRWRETNLLPFQRQAERWQEAERPDGLLLRGKELRTARDWSAQHAQETTPVERAFVDRSREHVRRRWQALTLGVAVGAAVSAVALWIVDMNATNAAEQRRFEIGTLVADAAVSAQAGAIEEAARMLEEARSLGHQLEYDARAEAHRLHGLASADVAAYDAAAPALRESIALDSDVAPRIVGDLLDHAQWLARRGEDSATDAYELLVEVFRSIENGGDRLLLADIICGRADLDVQGSTLAPVCPPNAVSPRQ